MSELSYIVAHPQLVSTRVGELLGVENPMHLVSEVLWITLSFSYLLIQKQRFNELLFARHRLSGGGATMI